MALTLYVSFENLAELTVSDLLRTEHTRIETDRASTSSKKQEHSELGISDRDGECAVPMNAGYCRFLCIEEAFDPLICHSARLSLTLERRRNPRRC